MLYALACLAFFAALVLCVLAWLWGPPLWRALQRARICAQPFPQPWRDTLRRRMPAFARLPTDVQLRLKKRAQVLIAEKPFIGCAGLAITDEMRVLITVQAALLLLRRGAGYFPALRQILVYPGAFTVERSTPGATGLVHEQRQALAGESWQQGQVLLSWADVLAGAADPHDGRNLVLHEFAHQLDQDNGSANGAPWLANPNRRAAWAQVMGTELGQLQQSLARGQTGLIDAYAATNPAEFFAVLSEVFFEQPAALAQQHPALFAQLAGYYGVNPLAWINSTAQLAR